MKSRFLTLIISLSLLTLSSCRKEDPVIDLVDFESLPLDVSGYWNGSDGAGSFTSGNILFINHYSAQYQAWSGFAYTNHSDTTVKDFTNQFCSVTGAGAAESEKYGIFFYSGTPDTIFFKVPEKVTDIAFSNSVYGYNAIRYGNQFCKKFGGETGNDPDWFKLTLTAIDAENNQVGYVDLYLADFRFDDKARDYIANAWTSIDLSTFGFISALKFEMSSSDSGPWGINNPAYVCIDNIRGELAIEPI